MAGILQKMFGSGKGGKGPSAQDAIQKLRETEMMLNKKSEFLEKKIEDELKLAKQYGTKNKRQALNHLKKKKRLEKQLQNIDGTLSTIEFQREALENAHTHTEVIQNMKVAAQAMKSAQQGLNVDDVHDIMDDLQEQNEIAEEIASAISQPIGFATEYDDDDLLEELEGLEEEDLERDLLGVPTTVNPLPEQDVELPPVPATIPKLDVKDEEDRQTTLC
jgi:charged multivesicular body protein 4